MFALREARSLERLMDTIYFFLHRSVAGLSAGERASIEELHRSSRVLEGKKALIVDDDMRNIFALSKALRSRKLQVTMAQDGYKALTQLEANPGIELVLMDIMMPGMDGYETIRRIRERDAWKKLPIIAVTAKAMTGDRERCIEAGANDYCAKPIDIDQLMSLIRVWV